MNTIDYRGTTPWRHCNFHGPYPGNSNLQCPSCNFTDHKRQYLRTDEEVMEIGRAEAYAAERLQISKLLDRCDYKNNFELN